MSLLFVLMFFFFANISSERIPAKVVLGPQYLVSPTTTSTSKLPPEPRRPAKAPWGPGALQSLRGRCFRLIIKEYEYSVCPGLNVTQRQTSQTWNSFWGILGLFDTWTTSASVAPDVSAFESEDMPFTNFAETFQREIYTDGTDCGGAHGQKRRNATVEYMCSGAGGGYALKNVTETTTCEYTLLLACPEACKANWLVSGTKPQSPEPTPTSIVSTTPTANPTRTPTVTASSIPISSASSVSPTPSSSSLSSPSLSSSTSGTQSPHSSTPNSPTSSPLISNTMIPSALDDSLTLTSKINDLKIQIDATTKNLQNLLGQLNDLVLEAGTKQ